MEVSKIVPFSPSTETDHENRVLLLQGPVGPFMSTLERQFGRMGIATDRVLFNAGDRLFSFGRRPANSRLYRYKDGAGTWAAWVRGLIAKNRYRAVVAFGATRPQHVIARSIAKQMGVPFVCLEEGYIRAGYVTVELDGNNCQSPLAGALPIETDKDRVPKSLPAKGFRWMCLWGFLQFGARNLFRRSADAELFHKRRRSWTEVPRWARNLYRWGIRKGDDGAVISESLAGRFDLVPLQVADDAQLTASGNGWNNRRLLAETIASFAEHAPEDRHLVFKVHPLERGHTRDHRVIEELARNWKVADRVHCILTGPLAPLARAARGVIVINSTSGLAALSGGTPLLVLGDALYRNTKLARCGNGREDIDRFWTDDFVADESLRHIYEPWLKANALVGGDFYAPRVATGTAQNVAQRTLALAQGAGSSVVTPIRPKLDAVAFKRSDAFERSDDASAERSSGRAWPSLKRGR